MTFPGDTAVLVLAAGPGTRMRSDTPKVLHTLAGRSMLSHVLHAIAKLAPQRLIVVLGHDHQRIAPLVGELADTLGRTIDVALQDRPLGTGHAVLCGLSALPDDYAGNVVVTSGDTPLLDADTLADLIATHRAVSAAVTVLTTTLDDPFGYGRILRTQDHEVMAIVEQTDATPSQREIREVNAGVYAFDIAALRSALSRLSSNNAQQGSTSPTSSPSCAPTARPYMPATSTTARWWPASTIASSWPSWPPNSTGGWWPLTSWPASPSSTRLPPGSTSTSPSAATPSFTRVPSCWAAPRSAVAVSSVPTPP